MPVMTSASVDAVIHQFWTEFAQGDRFWWTPVDVRVDPNELIADDDEGHLYRVPFSTDSDGNVTFDDPTRVVEEFRDIPEPAAAARGELAAALDAPASQRVLARFPTAATARPRDRVRASQTPDEGSPMNDEERRARALELGLAEDATDEQISEAEAAQAGGGNGDPEPQPTTQENQPDPPAPTASDRVVTVDREQFEQLRRDADQGVAARRTQLEAQADRLIEDARNDGRIAPASATAWRQVILPEGRTELVATEVAALAGLAKGRIPVDERGVAPTQDGANSAEHAQIMTAFGVKPRGGKEQ